VSLHEQLAQAAAERRLAYLTAMLYVEEEGVDGDVADIEAEFPDERSAGPYCGCDTCIVREVLDAAWPHILELAREEVRSSA
jgi:hypothetical protein